MLFPRGNPCLWIIIPIRLTEITVTGRGIKWARRWRRIKKADYYRHKAKAAEQNSAISSDDPQAVEKLKEKLQRLQKLQDHMKTVNAYYRKHGTMKGFGDLTDEKAAEIDEK